jgi:hypothetical protein
MHGPTADGAPYTTGQEILEPLELERVPPIGVDPGADLLPSLHVHKCRDPDLHPLGAKRPLANVGLIRKDERDDRLLPRAAGGLLETGTSPGIGLGRGGDPERGQAVRQRGDPETTRGVLVEDHADHRGLVVVRGEVEEVVRSSHHDIAVGRTAGHLHPTLPDARLPPSLRPQRDLLSLELRDRSDQVFLQPALGGVLVGLARVLHADPIGLELPLDRQLLRDVAGQPIEFPGDHDLTPAILGDVQGLL